MATVLNVYTDGACDPNPGLGGWGAVMHLDGTPPSDVIYALNGCEANTTNNRMEMLAVIKALEYVLESTDHRHVRVFSDSQYVVKTMTLGWKRNKNEDLWNCLDRLSAQMVVEWQWVRGHNGNLLNEVADQLATDGRAGNFVRV